MADINRQQVEQIGNGAAEVVRRGAAEARTTAEVAQQTTHLLWAGSQDMWRMLPGQQGTTPGNLPEMSQTFAGLFGDMLRTNLRIGQELVRLANPVATIELQQKLVHGSLDAIV